MPTGKHHVLQRDFFLFIEKVLLPGGPTSVVQNSFWLNLPEWQNLRAANTGSFQTQQVRFIQNWTIVSSGPTCKNILDHFAQNSANWSYT